MEDNLTTQLSENEKTEFENLEGIISREMKSFMDVGNALVTIRDRRLYREGFKTFRSYCAERWGMSKAYANRQISGSLVAANLAPIGVLCLPCEIQPTSEFQIRPLTRLEPDQQREAWNKANETAPNGKVTSKHVANTVKELTAPAPEPTPPSASHSGFASSGPRGERLLPHPPAPYPWGDRLRAVVGL